MWVVLHDGAIVIQSATLLKIGLGMKGAKVPGK